MPKPISYEMQMMFVGSPGALVSGPNSASGVTRLDFVQGYDFGIDIQRTPLKQIGSDSFANKQASLAPDVNLNFEYLLNDGWNEKYVGLDIYNNQNSTNPFNTVFSSTGDRNIYITIADNNGSDQNALTGINNTYILGVGNAYLTNYTVSVSVNQLARASCSFVGANAVIQNMASVFELPSVNTLGSGQPSTTSVAKFSFSGNSRTQEYINEFKEAFDGGCPYSNCKITPIYTKWVNQSSTSPITFGIFGDIADASNQFFNNFQSMELSFDFERKALYGFGSNYPYTRKVQMPAVGTLNLTSLVDQRVYENLAKTFEAEAVQGNHWAAAFDIKFRNTENTLKLALGITGATMNSYSYSSTIGDRVLVNTSWSFEFPNGQAVSASGSYGDPALSSIYTNESFNTERFFYSLSASAGGGYHSLAIDKNGKIWSWGSDNYYGQIGDGTTKYKFTPNKIFASKTFCHITAGSDGINLGYSLAIDKNGRAWAWGYNTYGQLGDNSTASRLTPVNVGGAPKTFCKIAAGRQHSLAIDKNGRVWAWGMGSNGLLGDNSNTQKRTPVSVVGSVKTFCQIAAARNHSLAIDKNGRAWSWGTNSSGQLGDNSLTIRLTPVSIAGAVKTFCKISAGDSFSLAIAKNGRAWAWGRNTSGQLGVNSLTSHVTPVSVLGSPRTFCQISVSDTHSLAIDKNGRAWAWGNNSFGQLGDTSITSRLTPVSVLGAIKTFCQISAGANNSLAIDKSGRVWGWGYNNFGSIGDGKGISAIPKGILGAAKTFCNITGGNYFAIATDKNGKIWSWGGNSNGELGNNSIVSQLTPVSIAGAAKTFCQIGATFSSSLAIDKNGRAWSWGANGSGQLGDNSTTSRLTPVNVAGAVKTFCRISVGHGTHCLAIDKNGRAWSWGSNSNGQLGDNSLTSRLTPVSVAGTAKTFCHISAGTDYSVAIDKNGKAWSWGSSSFGVLGTAIPIAVSTPVAVYGNTTFCKIAAGASFNLAIDKNGQIWSWGRNNTGQLANGQFAFMTTPIKIQGERKTFCHIGAGVSHSLAIDKNGKLWAWGRASYGNLGIDLIAPSIFSPIQVCTDLVFCKILGTNLNSYAIDSGGKVWAWGSSNYGALADGEKGFITTPVRMCNI